jgi:hypothetical protein
MQHASGSWDGGRVSADHADLAHGHLKSLLKQVMPPEDVESPPAERSVFLNIYAALALSHRQRFGNPGNLRPAAAL